MASSEDDDASGERDRLMQSTSSNGRLSFYASSGTPASKNDLEMGKMDEVFYFTDGAGGGPNTPHSTKRKSLAIEGPSLLPPEFINRLVNNPERGLSSLLGSRRPSTSSIDTLHAKGFEDHERSKPPTCPEEMVAFVKELANTYKKTQLLKEALKHSWALNDIHYVCPEDKSGDTILHIASKLGETKLVSAIAHVSRDEVNTVNATGNTALHFAAEFNKPLVIEALLKHGASLEKRNKIGFSALQIATLKCYKQCIEVLLKYGGDYRVVTHYGETLLHLACRQIWIKLQEIKEDLTDEICRQDSIDKAGMSANYCSDLENHKSTRERDLFLLEFPVLELLLDCFKMRPDLVEVEDRIPTSPGTPMHYFACFNYLDGIKTLLEDPFFAVPGKPNKNGLTPLWIASWYNNTYIGTKLLLAGADPNQGDPEMEVTPLHCAIYGYHINRVDETCNFIDALLKSNADPKKVDKSGETPAHLVIGTLDFRVMSKFIDYLGPESLKLQDESGNTLFHHAVASLDESSIYKLIMKGANLMVKNEAEIMDPKDSPRESGDHARRQGSSERSAGSSARSLDRMTSILIRRLPLQEAMKNGNSKNYFNAIRRLDFHEISSEWTSSEYEEFVCAHMIAAAREVRPDVVRLIFQNIDDRVQLHRILLFCDKSHEDETFTKTALEWAVENNDRLCTTEILHQEFECHKNSKEAGLSCLRRQLTGDELLMWTIETFTMFYERTFAQRTVIPVLGLVPLFLSISSFVYDYYSDVELTLQYFYQSTYAVDCSVGGKCPGRQPIPNDGQKCEDFAFERTRWEYSTAFLVNITCMCMPLLIFYAMCARELLPYVRHLEERISVRTHVWLSLAFMSGAYPLWMLVSLICAPFYILYIAARNVYFKFRHRRAKRKNIYRRELQRSEYLWGISKTAEAGLESCGQLVLQVWLLSADFETLYSNSFMQLVDKTYNGFVFFLTFGMKDASEQDKAMGKLFMSLLALVFGVSACYRTLKRGAVKMSNTFFIYVSLFLQVFARIMSIGLYFFAVRDFLPAIPLFLVLHFVLVFAIKWTFERARHLKGGVLTWLVATVNVFASSLVYVRIVPIEKPKRRRRDKSNSDECPSRASHAVEQHSTFFVQSLFFALALMENLLMASVPLLMDGNNRALACLTAPVLRDYMCRILALCVASWVFHTMYYKYMGHPWSDINGPDLKRGHLRFYFHFCGQERLFDCSCLKSRDGSEKCCCCCRRRQFRVSCNVQENEYCFPPLDDDECDDCDV